MGDWYRTHTLSPEASPEEEYRGWAQDAGASVDVAGNVAWSDEPAVTYLAVYRERDSCRGRACGMCDDCDPGEWSPPRAPLDADMQARVAAALAEADAATYEEDA